MNYVKAKTILPDNLVKEIQKYIQGQYVYIPSEPQKRKKWGENSGNRAYIQKRNDAIRSKYEEGYTINVLADDFFLSVCSIKKIIYAKTA
ncbi:MAG: CD3324 family protein [Clostridium sp.]|uniref:CD3324 family protein n=1 Tax=Clostridium sp. TaxID=1506 RepID=UPI003D6D935A